MNHASDRLILTAQWTGTVAVLAFVPSNLAIALILPCWWLLTFRRVCAAEVLLYAGICAIFTVMDMLAVAQCVFAFNQPDFCGLPCYEPLMWGFYVLHTVRVVEASPPRSDVRAWLLSVPFAAAFGCFQDPHVLLLVTGGLLAVALLFFHESSDLRCTAYMVLLGATVEYAGVWSGQWHYPEAPAGGVPLWFVTMWGGVGLFSRRLALPALHSMASRNRRLNHVSIVKPS